jgi:hypothetical protein
MLSKVNKKRAYGGLFYFSNKTGAVAGESL